MKLVLSLFPGIGMLDVAFEAAGFCVVRGPDLLWGGDVKVFHPPAGRFDGVIGGPPCKAHSRLVNMVRATHGPDSVAEDLIPEYERVVAEAAPTWFLMENVEPAPLPVVPGYEVHAQLVNNRWVGGVQNRLRRFSFGTRDGRKLVVADWTTLEAIDWEPAVTASAGGRRRSIALGPYGPNGERRPKGKQAWKGGDLKKWSLADIKRLQGLPPDFLDDAPFTVAGKREAVGNGVPRLMGDAIARAVERAVSSPAQATAAE